jgi:hypothetical protein
VRSRITFLTRLLLLKLLAFLTLVLLILYAPATTKTLWNGAGEVSVVLAKATDSSLQFIGGRLGFPPKQGAVELMSHIVGMDKVILFMGITIALYTSWLLAVALAMGIFRRKPARLQSVGGESGR